jgi:uncharacterized protein
MRLASRNLLIFAITLGGIALLSGMFWMYTYRWAETAKTPAGIMRSLDVCAGLKIPELAGRITDTANILAPDDKLDLEMYLGTFEENSGSQIAVLTVPTTDGNEIAALGACTLNVWQLGRRNIDDGVLITIAVKDRTARIDVGCGLESTITDKIAQSILTDISIPAFREAKYYPGLVKTIEAMVRRIEVAGLPAPGTPTPSTKKYVGPPSSPGCVG